MKTFTISYDILASDEVDIEAEDLEDALDIFDKTDLAPPNRFKTEITQVTDEEGAELDIDEEFNRKVDCQV